MLQLIIRKKSRECDRAVRYLKERRIPYQTLLIDEKDLSKKEWESILNSAVSPESLIDTEGREYREGGWAYREYDAKEALIMNPGLLRLPIFRKGQKCRFSIDDEFLREEK